MNFKYIMYNDHYGTGIISEASRDPKHILWSAIPENNSGDMYRDYFGYTDDDYDEVEIEEEIVKRIFNDNYRRLKRPESMSLVFNNLDTNKIRVFTSCGKLIDSELKYEDDIDVLDAYKTDLSANITFE
jgi:hypothetical protein